MSKSLPTPRKPVSAIDWQKARDRLSRVAAALDEAHRLSPERVRAILEHFIPGATPDAFRDVISTRERNGRPSRTRDKME